MRPLALSLAASVAVVASLSGCGPSEPQTKGGPVEMRRLTEDQYRNIIADVFGTSVTVAGHFDPIIRTNGLLAVGASAVNVTASAFERDENLARSIAAQVVDDKHRATLIPCKPASATAPDDACAKQFYEGIGRLLYRRPLTPDSMRNHVSIANAAAKATGDFYAGLARGLAGLLLAPNFLYIADVVEPDPDHHGQSRLDAYSKAARLSFLLWNTTPDDALLAAAEKGDLNSRDGTARQVDRLLASPRLKSGVRAFFADMFDFDDFAALSKDGVIFPAFSSAVAEDAKEQTLRTVVDLVVTRHGDYRDIFTTRRTFMSGALGPVYRVPAMQPGGGWVPYEFPDGDPRAGIVSQVSFEALHSHPGKSSPTLRGRALREILLCEKIPDPPANVKFDLFNDPNSPNKTARDRLTAHRTDPACAGCHKLMDPIGLTLENFDGIGRLRDAENGVTIDASGEIDGVPFSGPEGLGKMMHNNPAATACLVNRLYAYATGHSPSADGKEWMTYLEKNFAADGYRLPELLRRIALSDAFYAVGGATPPAENPAKAASTAATTDKEAKS